MKFFTFIRLSLLRKLINFPKSSQFWRCYICLWANESLDSTVCEKCGNTGAVGCDGYVDQENLDIMNKEL